jgi:hypothetical protein
LERINVKSWATIIATSALSAVSIAAAPVKPSVCASIAKNSHPSGSLIDEDGNASPGPINIGDYPAPNHEGIDAFLVKTRYRLLVWPKRIKVHWCQSEECLVLKPVPGQCANSKLFEISWITHIHAGERRPYQLGSGRSAAKAAGALNLGGGLRFDDPTRMEEVDVVTHSDTSIVGRLILPKQQKVAGQQ